MLLDLEKFDLTSIAEAIIEEMVITDQLPRSQSSKVLSALMAKHRHQHQMGRSLPRRSSSTNLASLFGMENKPTPLKVAEVEATPTEVSSACEAIDGAESIAMEPIRPRTTSDASSQTPFSALDYLANVSATYDNSNSGNLDPAKRCSLITLYVIEDMSCHCLPHSLKSR